MSSVACRRCGSEGPWLERPPFKNDLGTRVQREICHGCWQEWLKHQTLLINHYGLDPRDAESREFLYQQVESVLLGGGEGEEVDTSKKGTITW